jgi:capsular polysaccharide transport system permease protein
VTNLLQSFRLQGRVTWALILREMQTRYGRENIGFLWIVGEPILFCAGVAVLWTLIRPSHEHGLPMTAYVVTGYVPLTMWRHCIGRGMKAFEANGALLFHRHVTPLDIILARWVLEVIGTLIAGLIVAGGAIFLGFMDPPQDIGLLYLGLLYQMFFCLGFMLLIASASERSDLIEKFMAVVMYLSLPLSGAFVMVSWVPEKYQWILLLSPSVQNVEMIRGGQFGLAAHAIYQIPYATYSIAVVCFIGLSLTLRSRRFITII